MKETLKAYKVVRVPFYIGQGARTKRKYAFSCYAPEEFALPYNLGRVTRAREGTKLFVFKHLHYARSFASTRALDILEVECGDSLERMGVRAVNTPSCVEEFWLIKNQGKTIYSPRIALEAPDGTYVCDWVRPIKRVKRVWK